MSKSADELIALLAKLIGETKTEAVTQALKERLERVRRARAKRGLADDLDEIALRGAARPGPARAGPVHGIRRARIAGLMLIDTSALLALAQNEPEHRRFNTDIEAAHARLVSAARYVDCSMILESRYGAEGVRDFDHFVARTRIAIAPVDEPLPYQGDRFPLKWPLRGGPHRPTLIDVLHSARILVG